MTKFNHKCHHFSICSIINTYLKGLDQFVLNWIRTMRIEPWNSDVIWVGNTVRKGYVISRERGANFILYTMVNASISLIKILVLHFGTLLLMVWTLLQTFVNGLNFSNYAMRSSLTLNLQRNEKVYFYPHGQEPNPSPYLL